MDHIAHFERETTAFHRVALMAALPAAPPLVPSCPDWTTSDLVRHLGRVHRLVNLTIVNRLEAPPTAKEKAGVVPKDASADELADWFAEGAIALAETFRATDPKTHVWTWGKEQDVAFWSRMESIEAAVHRWDIEGAIGNPQPVDKELAGDAVAQFLEVMAPSRRVRTSPPPMAGERYRFRQSDGSGVWSVALEPEGLRPLGEDELADVELAGTASDLALFLWHRIPGEPLLASGNPEMLERFFELIPPV